eukprot:TRINITY_DN27902_c0_g3_i1.p1 TRINITY_DN27902_c0_g3~~TRINITY_DN27902_c0_g3_i1.p1  ORF type:complete len:270 (-),score=93.67 TRINITY_DN27902_c0_g3_i1:1-810(-)
MGKKRKNQSSDEESSDEKRQKNKEKTKKNKEDDASSNAKNTKKDKVNKTDKEKNSSNAKRKKKDKAKKGREEAGDSSDAKKRKKDKEKKGVKDKDEGGKSKEKKEKQSKDEERGKKDGKEKHNDVRPSSLPAEPPASLLGGGAKEPKKEKKDKKDNKASQLPTKQVDLSASTAYGDASRPFGIELDGALVVDLADEGAAIPAGVQIGWRVLEVAGKAVPEDDVGKAAEALRQAETKMESSDGKKPVSVVFVTEEPGHWKAAAKALSGRR